MRPLPHVARVVVRVCACWGPRAAQGDSHCTSAPVVVVAGKCGIRDRSLLLLDTSWQLVWPTSSRLATAGRTVGLSCELSGILLSWPRRRTVFRSPKIWRTSCYSDRIGPVAFRLSNKPVQIHHINDDPSDNRSDNLAVLCVVCHNETQITGGFGRKLNAGQVTWYRNDWPAFVEARRTGGPVKFEAIGARLSAMDSGQILYDSANKIKGGSPRLDSILEHMQEAQRQTLANRDKYLTWLKELEALAA